MQPDNQRESLQSAQPVDFAVMLDALKRPAAFAYPVFGDEPVSMIQTHASAVLLAADCVYKLKKPRNFGFFDYSTPELRRHFCIQEVLLNRRLAPRIYPGVAPVLYLTGSQFRFGSTCSPDEVPQPGTRIEGWTVVDYAVVMQRLPEEATLESLVRAGTATPALLATIARYIAAFHLSIPTDAHIASFGTLAIIRKNWEENFAQLRPFIGRTLDSQTFERLSICIHRYLDARALLFEQRVRAGFVRDCHGDLRLQHIYLLTSEGSGHQPESSIAVLDGIEFNERFRYGDVASEVAFLAMELDAAGRPDLTEAFVAAYIDATGDDALRELLPFYKCYRACVRGKVASFQLDESEVPPVQREQSRSQAIAMLNLAVSYTTDVTVPTVLMLGGLMGTGKSTLALTLQRTLGWKLFSSDTLRKRLARLDPTQPQAAEFGQGLYSPEWSLKTYTALVNEERHTLEAGRSVILDATFLQRSDRQTVAKLAVEKGCRCVFVECICPPDVALERLERRWQARLTGTQEHASLSSDARPVLYAEQAVNWQKFLPDQERDSQHLVVDTSQPLATSLEQVHTALFKER